jgi:DNA mismatch repair ATPase MutS
MSYSKCRRLDSQSARTCSNLNKGTHTRVHTHTHTHTPTHTPTHTHTHTQVVEVAATYIEVWESVANLLADLDVLCSLAEAATAAPVPYVRPVLLDADCGEISIVGGRHPCVEVQVWRGRVCVCCVCVCLCVCVVRVCVR